MSAYKTVPVEPTAKMFSAFVRFAGYHGGLEEFREDWQRALAASPSPAPRPDITELRALGEKWLSGDKFRDGEDCANELEALIERGF